MVGLTWKAQFDCLLPACHLLPLGPPVDAPPWPAPALADVLSATMAEFVEVEDEDELAVDCAADVPLTKTFVGSKNPGGVA